MKKSKEYKRFKRSQAAHKRLGKRHNELYLSTGEGEHWICEGYHNDVYARQASLGRVLTDKEKEEVYRVSAFYWYN